VRHCAVAGPGGAGLWPGAGSVETAPAGDGTIAGLQIRGANAWVFQPPVVRRCSVVHVAGQGPKPRVQRPNLTRYTRGHPSGFTVRDRTSRLGLRASDPALAVRATERAREASGKATSPAGAMVAASGKRACKSTRAAPRTKTSPASSAAGTA